ncbi:MAG: UDP-3-O-acyl-N-acetylglucosamine deacetylase [Holosporales bacterium]|jgi:UDP-3-O-[3-hydroxymyristoyl] N-acetylglucosamine deacetylase|nr:UDP-3-O-acyl-N-acetylglucosamine deacetylase [Holosporales bacterium]
MFSNLRFEATINSCVEFVGVGVHSGKNANMRIFPAPERTGIVFKRIDLKKGQIVKPSPDAVVDPKFCTRIINKSGVSVFVVEHLLAAFRISGITNAIVELDSEEVPIMDGSAITFLNEFKKSGILYQDSLVPAVVISRTLTVESGNGRISLIPEDTKNVSVKISYDRINPVIGENNRHSFDLDDDLSSLADSRTFGWFEDYEKVKSIGLAKGTSEENTIAILSDNTVKNKGGLRNPNELVMHKCLDLIGDISVIGYDIIGKIEGFNTSHLLNNLLMRALLKEISYHKIITQEYTKALSQTINFA